MAALNVNIIVDSVSISQASNNYTVQATIASGDTSQLSNFTLSFTGPGTTPRYTVGSTAVLPLP
jgi:hypothetical protein